MPQPTHHVSIIAWAKDVRMKCDVTRVEADPYRLKQNGLITYETLLRWPAQRRQCKHYLSWPVGHEPTALNESSILWHYVKHARTIELASCFEDWAQLTGRDPDSRDAERLYHGYSILAKHLRKFLAEHYDRIVLLGLEEVNPRD